MAAQLPDVRTPLVLFSNAADGAYLGQLERRLRPRRVIFADAALRRAAAPLRADNYLVFATERAIAARAARAFQLGYQPCGRVTRGWGGTWHP